MWEEQAEGWRRELLAAMLRWQPVSAFIFVNRGAFCVRDGSGLLIYADDLGPLNFDGLLGELAELLVPADGEAMLRALCLSALENLARRGVRSARLPVRRRGKDGAREMLWASARLWGDASNRTVELKFERWK